METHLKAQSATVLEQTTSPDGLVQLVPRKRKVGDVADHNGSCNGSGLFASSVFVPPIVGETHENESSRSGTSSGHPPAPILNPVPTPVPFEAPIRPPVEKDPQPKRPVLMEQAKSLTRATRPTHLDLPPPPELKSIQSPQKTPSPSATRLPQLDITPGLQVLVVDDDKMTRMLFQRMLGRLKCSVTTAVNGYEALQLITGDQNVAQTPAGEEHEHLFSDGEDRASIMETDKEKEKEEKESKFAIVFLDNQMPVMSGVEMMRKLRRLGRNDLVVGVTGESSLFLFPRLDDQRMDVFSVGFFSVGNALLPDQEEYLEAGVDHILTKPVREESVRKMLAIADERRKIRLLDDPAASIPDTPPPDST